MLFDEFSTDNPLNTAAGRSNRLVPATPAEFKQIERLFIKGWKHSNKPLPQVQRVFKILSPRHHLASFLKYRSEVDASLRSRKRQGNEQLLFHGTERACDLGEADNVGLCRGSKCSLCSIIRCSFDTSLCGSKHNFTRFGAGIYSTSCSSKADDYVSDTISFTKCRALLVSRVIVGHPYKLRQNATALTKAPQGHHSILGVPGKDLNYPETVVYTHSAIRPAYLVIYRNNPAARRGFNWRRFRIIVKRLFTSPLIS